MPCAVPVRASGTVSAIIFCTPSITTAVEKECSDWAAKKPPAPSPSGQISGIATQRSIAAQPAKASRVGAGIRSKKRRNTMYMQTSETTAQAQSNPTRPSPIPSDFQ